MNIVVAERKYHLFLDDARKPSDVKWLELPPLNWVIVRSYNEFVRFITDHGVPTTVSFDHDLADEHYQEYTRAHDPLLIGERKIKYENFKERTGYDCAKWLANYCVDNNHPLPLYYIHTLNPIGRENIFSAMESARGYLKTFFIPDLTAEQKSEIRKRIRERQT